MPLNNPSGSGTITSGAINTALGHGGAVLADGSVAFTGDVSTTGNLSSLKHAALGAQGVLNSSLNAISGGSVTATAIIQSGQDTFTDSGFADSFYLTANPSVDGKTFAGGVWTVQIPAANTRTFHEVDGGSFFVSHSGSGTVDNAYALQSEVDIYGGIGPSLAGGIWGHYATLYLDSSAVVTNATGVEVAMSGGPATVGSYWGFAATAPTGITITNAYDFWASDLSGSTATNPYYSWFNSRGVRRVKEDATFDSVGQAIEALYNPQFAKYTPGAADYERVILGQWNGNVAEIGTEAGGTGTSRALRLIGPSVKLANLTTNGHVSTSGGDGTLGVSATIPASHISGSLVFPDADPHDAGAGYWVAGVFTKSAG